MADLRMEELGGPVMFARGENLTYMMVEDRRWWENTSRFVDSMWEGMG